MRRLHYALSCAVIALAHPASAQVANTYCAGNPAACQPVNPGFGYPNAYATYAPTGYAAPGYGGYGGYPAPGYGGYGGYPAPGYGGGYGGYPPPGYYGPGGAAQAQSLGAITQAPRVMPGQYGQQEPFQPNQPTITEAAPPHPANANFSRYAANIFGDANRPSKVVQRTARSAGIRDGYIEESKRIAAYLDGPDIAQRLDQRYPLAAQMVGPDIVPPVITELREIRQTPNRSVLVTTVGSYEILRQARMSVAPPNWRDYLTVTPPPSPEPSWTPPKNAEEQAHWDASYKVGLDVGILQARSAFDDGMARLDRDFAGMRRYHGLAAQGAVSLPLVKAKGTGLRVSRNGQSATVGEHVVKLVVTPKFQRSAAALPSE